MKRLVSLAGCLAVIPIVTTLAASPAQAPAGVPTFNADIAPILFANCVTCHRPGEVAPMSLLTYDEVRPWARAIKAKVLTREMPPWFADPQFGKFRNERRLSQAQIDALTAWVDGDAPQGPGAPPRAPRFPPNSSGFMERPPDYVLQMPAEIKIPAVGEPPYVKLWSKSPFGRDVYLEAVELRPGNRKVTHHSSTGGMPLPSGARIRTAAAWPGGPEVKNAVALLGDGTAAVDGAVTGNVLVFYVPGGGFQRFPPGMARRLRRDDYILWSVHYMPTGKEETDRHTLAVWIAKSPPTHQVVTAAASEQHLVEGQPVAAGDERAPAIAGDAFLAGAGRSVPEHRREPREHPGARRHRPTGRTGRASVARRAACAAAGPSDRQAAASAAAARAAEVRVAATPAGEGGGDDQRKSKPPRPHGGNCINY